MSQVAFDRYAVELPPAEPGYAPLADPEEVELLARFLWSFGTQPVLALVASEDATWCQPWSPRRVSWVPGDAVAGVLEIAWQPEHGSHAVVLQSEDDVRHFLSVCPAISRVAVLWPRVDIAKCFMRLAENADWRPAADAVAFFAPDGWHLTVQQLA